uniref:Uncharacterized protein n=1 Tax=Oryza punctata TaxID=4537 RepID=A0A0E0LQK4_ORYPU
MGVVIEREEWALTPLAYPLLSAASLAAVLLLPYFSPPSHAAASSSSHSPFDVGTTPFLRFRRGFLFVLSLASVAEGIHSVFGEDEFARCGLGREQMAARLAAAAAAALFLGGLSGVVSDKLGPRQACILYWMLQLVVGALKSFSGLRCAWISNLILALASSMFYFCFETWFVVEHEKADGRDAQLSLIFPCFLASRMFGSASFPWFYGATAPFRNEDSLTIAYVTAGIALSIVAYDYQDIGTLVILFCIFHACVGFILPSLARLRTMTSRQKKNTPILSSCVPGSCRAYRRVIKVSKAGPSDLNLQLPTLEKKLHEAEKLGRLDRLFSSNSSVAICTRIEHPEYMCDQYRSSLEELICSSHVIGGAERVWWFSMFDKGNGYGLRVIANRK